MRHDRTASATGIYGDEQREYQLTMAAPASAPVRRAIEKRPSLTLWMNRVLEECDRASVEFAADPVHDLRVALRRCRSMADGMMAIDPDPSWKRMKKAGKLLFSSLGELRDTQVMEEWVHKLGAADDPVTERLLQYLAHGESDLKMRAAQALQEFDRRQWKRWAIELPRRAGRIRIGGLVFKHLALERWTDAYALHRIAMRNRSQTAFHALRIGIKRFRYIVENFLPQQHVVWSNNLKELQDLLGEVHDLDVLWATALQISAFPNPESRSHWHSKVLEERTVRVDKYKGKMTGKESLWFAWRMELPEGKQIEDAALSRLKLWGSVLDPNVQHANHVARLALQLYDGLPSGKLEDAQARQERTILQAAALLHDVGRSQKGDAHHKASYRLIRQMKPPLGWNSEAMLIAGAAARYHHGAFPQARQKTLRGLNHEQRQTITRLAAILRLANALDAEADGRIRRVRLASANGHILVEAEGYSANDRMAEEIAAGRHLLETVYRKPVLVKPLKAAQPRKPGIPLRRSKTTR
jgi:CHAD domain-containing protein/HD superfamily phosphodiesterase